MAEINVGDVVAHLKANTTQFEQALTQVRQRLADLAGRVQATTQAQASGQQSTTQLAQAYRVLAQSISEQTRAQSQAQQASLAYRREQDQIRDSLRQQAQAVRETGSAWQTMLTIAGGIGLAGGLTAFVGQLRQVITHSVMLAGRMQDLHIAFRAIEGSTGAANRTLAFLFDTAQRLGVEFTSLTDGFKRMEQAAKGTGLQGEGIRDVFVGVAQGARQLGVSSENVSRSLVALEQILTKNRAGAEEINQQLGDAIPGSVRTMADALGVGTKEFQEMAQLGIIPAEAAVIAFGKGMSEIGSAGVTGPIERVTSVFAQLKNETTAWMTALGDSINSVLGPFLRDLTSISEKVRELLGIRGPGQQSGPGASQGFGLGPLTPRSTGFLPGSAFMPSEFETPQAQGLAFATSPFDALIRAQAGRIGFDPTLFSRLVKQESGFRPRAVGPVTARGEQARGLGQIMPSTGAEYGLITNTDFFDPEKNLTAAADVLRDYRAILQKKFGTLADETRILLAAYNAGIGNVIKAVEETQRIGEKVTFSQVLGRLPKPSETGPYVESITGQVSFPSQVSAAAPASSSLDPFASMLKTSMDTADSLTTIQQRMDNIAQSGLNFGGVLNDALTKQADEAVKKFTQVATLLAAFPEMVQRMTPAQRESLEQTARQVALIQQRLSLEAQSEGDARQRIQELRAIEQLQDRLEADQFRDLEQGAKTRLQALRELEAEEARLLEQQRALAMQYGHTKQARDADTSSMIVARLATTQYATETQQLDEFLQSVARIEAQLPQLRAEAARSGAAFETSRSFTEALESTMDRLSAPRDQRTSVLLRAQATRRGVEMTEAQQHLLQEITARERLNMIMDTAGRIGDSTAQIITNGLLGMISATESASQAFKQMAKGILDSLSQILVHEGLRALFRLGLGALSGALAGGATGGFSNAGASAGGGAGGFEILMAQHGAVVNKPTLIMAGEASGSNPEFILNRMQMDNLMRTGPSAGGQAMAPISIINVASREQGEERAAAERAMGRQVVLNYVLDELSQGSGSRISQVMRSTLR